MQQSELKFAVLIDADNVPSTNLREMMEEVAKFGSPTYKRIYADWTKPHVNRWKELLLEHAIIPVQQYSYTQGKNATDSAMIIDAMDILYTGKVDGFCIISSDSDFTRLALRLREAGMQVIGMGQKKTPAPFIAACNKFVYIEILKTSAATDVAQEKTEDVEIKPIDKAVVKLISNSVSDLADETGWAYLGDIGSLIIKKHPDFDSRNYGFKKLGELIKSTGLFDINERATDKGNGNIKHVYVKLKEKTRKPRRKTT